MPPPNGVPLVSSDIGSRWIWLAPPNVGDVLEPRIIVALLVCGIIAIAAARARRAAAVPLAQKAATSAVAAAQLRRNAGAPAGGHVVVVNAEPCTPRVLAYANDPEPSEFHSEVCSGLFLSLHRPTDDPDVMNSDAYPYASHFKGRKRLWEFRFQIKFTQEIPDDSTIMFGAEQDQYYKVGRAQRYLASTLVAALKAAAPGLYQSYGDDPSNFSKGEETERPHLVLPLWLMDQLVITDEGDDPPPNLCDPGFTHLGITKAKDRRKFRSAISELRFKPGPTYTFAVWCVAQFCDTLLWRAPGRGLLPEFNLAEIGVYPPGYLTMYVLKPPSEEQKKTKTKKDPRHLDSRKIYIWRAAFWSSHLPPPKQRVGQLTDGGSGRALPTSHSEVLDTNPRKRSMWCCG